MRDAIIAMFILVSGIFNEDRAPIDCLALSLQMERYEQAYDVDMVFHEDCTVDIAD